VKKIFLLILAIPLCGMGSDLKVPVEGLVINKSLSHSPALTKGQKNFGRDEKRSGEVKTDKINFKRVLSKLIGQPHSTILLDDEKFSIDYEFFSEGIIGKIAIDLSQNYNLAQTISELKAISPLVGLIIDLRKNKDPAPIGLERERVTLVNEPGSPNEKAKSIDLRKKYTGPLIIISEESVLQLASNESLMHASKWLQMIPQLVQNTSLRKETDQDLNHFYQNLKDPEIPSKEKASGCGPQDLFLKEATNMIKDMIFLSSQQ
jgi:hypothetical protein